MAKRFFKGLWDYIKRADIILWLLLAMISAYSLVLLRSVDYATGSGYFRTQLLAIGLGVAAAVVVTLIDYAEIANFWYLLAGFSIFLMIYTSFFGEQVVGSALSPEFAQVLRTCSHFPEDLNAALEGKAVEKIHIFHVPPERRQELLDAVEACGPLAVTTSFGDNMELTAPGVTKGSAVQALCARLGLGPDQVMAFGDAGNDLELLSWASWSFAMANASDEAKAAARYITGTNREGGVGMAVEQYLLNA